MFQKIHFLSMSMMHYEHKECYIWNRLEGMTITANSVHVGLNFSDMVMLKKCQTDVYYLLHISIRIRKRGILAAVGIDGLQVSLSKMCTKLYQLGGHKSSYTKYKLRL